MAKSRSIYVCGACGYETPRWVGKCPGCGAWNSLEESVAAVPEKTSGGNNTRDKIFLLSYAEANRYLDVQYKLS